MFLGGYDFSLDRLDKTELCYGNGAGRKESIKVEGMQVKSGKDMEKMDVCMKTLVEMGVTLMQMIGGAALSHSRDPCQRL